MRSQRRCSFQAQLIGNRLLDNRTLEEARVIARVQHSALVGLNRKRAAKRVKSFVVGCERCGVQFQGVNSGPGWIMNKSLHAAGGAPFSRFAADESEQFLIFFNVGVAFPRNALVNDHGVAV